VIAYQPLTLYPSKKGLSLSPYEGKREENLLKGFLPHKNLVFVGTPYSPLLIPLLNNLYIGRLRGVPAPLNKTLPLMQRIHLPIMERGIKGVRLLNDLIGFRYHQEIECVTII